jgi:hypothetical protein
MSPVVSYECKTWSLNVKEEQRLRATEDRVVRTLFGHTGEKVIRQWKNFTVRNFIICTLQNAVDMVI